MNKLILTNLLLLFFCVSASAQIIRDVEELTPDTRLVYGSLQLYEEGELMKRSARRRFFLLVLPADSDQALMYRINRDDSGEFFLALEPGDYTLLGYHWEHKGVRTNSIEADFSVPEAGGDVYIGSIDIHSDATASMFVVEDQFDEMASAYDARFPQRQGTSVKQLLQVREPIGDYRYISHPCHPDWNIDCGGRYQGVVPISPRVTRQPFPLIDNLTPRFSWEPSPLEGVTYDFVLYQAVTYTGGMLLLGNIKGRVVEYQQDLQNPYWQPEMPLNAGAKYYWSVRFRDGDQVSEWSTHSHFFTIIIASSMAYGQWFQFETPNGEPGPSARERARAIRQ